MPPCHPTFEVIAFHAPVVESGVLRQVIHTDTGLRQLVAPVEAWKSAIAAQYEAMKNAVTSAAAQQPRRSTAVASKCYEAAVSDFKSGRAATRAAAAIANGVSPAAFYVWLNRQRQKGRAV